jgi:isoamylase
LNREDPRFYEDTTGTGNSLSVRHPRVLQLIMDSLRYWVQEMHVDGFRFELASSLARPDGEVDRLSPFFTLVQQDPVISQVKLIAEPWDVGAGGYQVGHFPAPWAEWNGRFRDVVRGFWRGDSPLLGDLATRLTASPDLYQDDGRKPTSSVNYVTCHDGFTLRDLVSYNDKHNEANGEGNRDGSDQNRSWNCGIEGPTDDEAVLDLRARQQRNLLVTLLVSQGVPMLSHGDELGRTQYGNNNAFCQDNPVAWVDWELTPAAARHLEFTRQVVGLRRSLAGLRQRRHLTWVATDAGEGPSIAWFGADGSPMDDARWADPRNDCVAMYLGGGHLDDVRGQPVYSDPVLVLVNGMPDGRAFTLPPEAFGEYWSVLVDTSTGEVLGPKASPSGKFVLAGDELPVAGRSIIVLTRTWTPAPPLAGSEQPAP